MTGPDVGEPGLPLSALSPEQKAKQAGSFGGVAALYERFRPGPSPAAVDWILPEPVGRVVDLGAGTGALTRLLVDRAREVVAIEPDDQMRAVLAGAVPGVRAVKGWGESMPIPDGSVDAVLASTSWHWMDPIPALHEVGRVLVPRGVLGALWTGPDPEGPFLVQAQAMFFDQASGATRSGAGVSPLPEADVARLSDAAHRPVSTLEIPDGVPFEQPDHEVFRWDVALNADELIGLLGTFSWIITMPDDSRRRVIDEARRVLRDALGVDGEVTVDVAWRADTWRTRRHD